MSPQFKRFESKDRSCFSIRWNPSTAPHAVSQILGHRIEPRIDYVFSPGLTQQIIAPEEITQPVYEQLLNWINSHNNQALEHSYFFFPHHARLAEAKLISAFSSNGIGFTPARANDSCYAHLVEAADSWSLLGCLKLDEKIDEGKQFNDLTGPTELLLMIEKNDLEADRLDKCFIVRYWD
jgi:hypothetical protein